MPKVIRCGQQPEPTLQGISQADVDCLQGFWELEQQRGIRAIPTDNILNSIPDIILDRPTKGQGG